MKQVDGCLKRQEWYIGKESMDLKGEKVLKAVASQIWKQKTFTGFEHLRHSLGCHDLSNHGPGWWEKGGNKLIFP